MCGTRLFALGLLVALALLLAACDSSDDSAPTTGTPDATSVAGGFVPPAKGFVYAELLTEPGANAVYRIAVFDAEQLRDAAEFEVRPGGTYPPQPFMLAGDRVLVKLDDRIQSFALDGSDSWTLHTAQTGGGFMGTDVSSDESLLAVAETTRSQCPTPSAGGSSAPCESLENVTRLSIIDLESGDAVLQLNPGGPPLTELPGAAFHVYWWANGSAVTVHGFLGGETAPSAAVLTLDGDLRVSRVLDFHPERPDGRYMFTGERVESCSLDIYRIEAAIVDLADDAVVASVRDERRLVGEIIWSPDGAALLFSTHTFNVVPPPEGSGVTTMCRERVEGSEQWGVLHTDGAPPEMGIEPFAVIDGWYGDQLITFSCQGERRFDERYCTAGGVPAPAEVLFRGRQIASTTEFHLLGWID